MTMLRTPTPQEVKKFGGIPEMPADYWEYWQNEPPLFKMGKLTRPKTWIVGFNGARGGGKSGSAAYVTAEERLLRGIPVYTIPESYYIHVPIIWKGKVYDFHSEPLVIDDLFAFKEYLRGCAVMADEANIQLADSHKSMSNRNLAVSDYAQQARHLETSFFYTVIAAGWIDPRLRQLTDVLVYCSDCAAGAAGEAAGLEEGEYVNWSLSDNSGMLTGIPYEIEPYTYPWTLRLKDFWEIYNSHNLSDTQNARRNVQYNTPKIQIEIGEQEGAEQFRAFTEQIERTVNAFARARQDEDEILVRSADLWKTLGVSEDNGLQRQAGIFIKNSLSLEVKKKADGNYYDLTPLVTRL